MRKSQLDNINLSIEQQRFITKAKEGNNILVDACIGSGKTTAIQMLCNELPDEKRILYLTYNKLLKIDAKTKIKRRNATVTNYHGFAAHSLRRQGISSGVSDLIQNFNRIKPPIEHYDVLILDEYQDIEQELAEMLDYIKSTNPQMQIIAVGDMAQKIYDKTSLNVPDFIYNFLGIYISLEFTVCFRLSQQLAEKLGRIWRKKIVGVNENCLVEEMSKSEVTEFLSKQKPSDILCLGARQGDMSEVLNDLENNYPDVFNKNTVFASIADKNAVGATEPKASSAIFTTFDSSKGLERKICVVFDFTESYWNVRINKPLQSYEILRNIFCVAASRGKEHIIFVKSEEAMLSEDTLSTPESVNLDFGCMSISDMFDFKYREDVEECYSLLEIKPQLDVKDLSVINIKNSDGLIDLSPCIGTYQEAVFFEGYDVDKDIDLYVMVNKNRSINRDSINELSLDEKILFLTSLETHQERYRKQVETPFVTELEKSQLVDRLNTTFSRNEKVQVQCSIDCMDKNRKRIVLSAIGYADVVKDNIVYELKFVSELSHEHFLQCACYVVAMGLEKGILWNTRNNFLYEITVPDEEKFLNAVVKAVTKGRVKNTTPLRMRNAY